MKNCADYNIMICIHYPRIGYNTRNKDEIAKKIRCTKILSGNLQQWVEKMGFGNRLQYSNTWETARARHIKLVDKSIDAFKLSTLLAQVKHILIWIVNVEKQPD